MNYKTRLILILSFILTLGIFAGLMTYTLAQFDSVRIKSEAIVQNNNTKVDLINTMYTAARDRVRGMFIMMNIDDAFDLDEAVIEFHNQGGIFTKARQALEQRQLSPQERLLLNQQGEFQRTSVPIQLKIVEYIESENRETALKLLHKEGIDAQNQTLNKLKELIDLQRISSQNILKDIGLQHDKSVQLILTWSIFAFALGSILAFSAVLKISRTEKQLSLINAELETRVEDRTKALKNANSHLVETIESLETTQKQLVESEKMASLGSLVAGVAHEVNTPLGVGLTSSSLLKDHVIGLKKRVEDQKLTQADLVDFLSTAEETSSILEDNLYKAADLIASFKQLAVDQTSDQTFTFDIYETLHSSLTSLNHVLKKQLIESELLCNKQLRINSNAGSVSQVITNLIMNASIHAFDDSTPNPRIAIKVTELPDNSLEIRFIDNGKGMSEEVTEKAFEPFFTTRRGQGGSGLGLHLVYNLVSHKLKGVIQVESELGKGTTFTIKIPNQSDQT